jgi:hypothetical protein
MVLEFGLGLILILVLARHVRGILHEQDLLVALILLRRAHDYLTSPMMAWNLKLASKTMTWSGEMVLENTTRELQLPR